LETEPYGPGLFRVGYVQRLIFYTSVVAVQDGEVVAKGAILTQQ